MFRRSNANQIEEFFALPLKNNELAFFYLGVSGFLARSANHSVIFDPASFLKGDEVKALKKLDLMFFTHGHLDHFRGGAAEAIFKATGAAVLAEPKVANKLKGKMPSEKLVTAESGKTYTFGDITARAVVGIHRGPIMLYQTKMDGITLFHGGDSGYVSLKDYPSQVAIVPVGRLSPTASPENAFKMAADIKPQVALTMHGSDKQKLEFEQKVKEAMPQTKVLIMKPFTMQTVAVQSSV